MAENLEEFFKFIYRRQLIWYKRFVLNEKPPWTDDFVLKTYKMINMYRELDRCTIYILRKLSGVKDRKSLLLNVVFYRFFNRDGFYEKLGIEPFQEIDENLRGRLIYSLDNLRKKEPIFSNAYLISSGVPGKEKHVSIVDFLSDLDFEKIVSELDSSKTPEESFKVLLRIPMVGPFLACEIWTDLTYFYFFKQGWNDNDFVNIGPGARWGLEILAGGRISKLQQKKMLNELYEKQFEILPEIHKKVDGNLSWGDIAYKGAYSNYPYLSITNIEGALCEFRKYYNLSRGKGKRRYFHYS